MAEDGLTLRRAACLCAYTTACALVHGLLQRHYVGTCRGTWLALFGLDPGPYCALLRRGLSALQWSPVLVLSGAFPQLLLLQHPPRP